MNYNCWYCNKDCENEKQHGFSFEFDAPICDSCLNKLFAKAKKTLNREETIIRNEFEAIRQTVSTYPNEDFHPIKMDRVWAMPNKNTFDIKPIHDLINEELNGGIWIDPFANKNKIATVTNDLNPEYDTNYHLDALEFLKMFDNESIDGVLYDPPYSPRQVSESYNNFGFKVTQETTRASFWSAHKKEISRILKIGGKVIVFGWNSGGIGASNGFRINRIRLIPHGGWHNDTICTVETKLNNKTL